MNANNAWIDNAYLDQRERGAGRVDDLINRLHIKQEEALDRVRKQQEEINRRNQLNRANFGTNTMMGAQMTSQIGTRSYYGPTLNRATEGRRFYSP